MDQVGQRKIDGMWLTVVGIAVLFFLILPTLIVIPISFSGASFLEFPPKSFSLRWYEAYFSSPEWMSGTKTSLIAAVITTIIATPLGTLCAYGLHCSTPRVRNTLQILVIMPIVVPVILIAVGVFSLYAKLGLNYTLTGIIIAHTALALPFVIVTVMSGLQNYDFDQELAARSMGASRAVALWTITVPQVKFSIQTGAFLDFITSLDKDVISMMVSGGDNATITRRMFNTMRDHLDPTIAAISTCLIVVSVTALIGVQLIGRRKNIDK